MSMGDACADKTVGPRPISRADRALAAFRRAFRTVVMSQRRQHYRRKNFFDEHYCSRISGRQTPVNSFHLKTLTG
jgi:hypothetical protein